MAGEWAGAVLAGLLIALVTAPAGVSGAVFLLPVQLSLLGVPSPAVTPTNLVFNLISVPGSLARYRRRAPLRSPLTRLLLAGTLPGVVAGAVLRVLVVPDGSVFRVLVALLLAPLGCWLIHRAVRPVVAPADGAGPRIHGRALTALGLGAGLVGGVYGIGGGSLLAPVLVGVGYEVGKVAPAALSSTFVTSVFGVAAYLGLALSGHPQAAPDWGVAIACGAGGLVGGYLGAALQPLLPRRALTFGLGAIAVLLSLVYGFGG